MTAVLTPTLVIVGGFTATVAVWLFVTKAIRQLKWRFDEFRRASYIGAISEIATRSGYPLDTLRAWAPDMVFLETLLDFLRFVQGTERANLLRLARDLGIVERFTDDLAHGRSRQRRVAAAEALGELGDASTVDVLLSALDDRVPEVRLQAADALARIGDPRCVRPLVELLAKEEDWGASRIADSLVRLGSDAVDDLARYLMLPDGKVATRHRPLIVRVLGVIGDVRAEPALLASLDCRDDEVRIRAAAALATAGGPRGIPALIRALHDELWEVRSQAAKSLGVQMDFEAVGPLRVALRDPSWWVRRNAAQALGRIPGGVRALVDALDDEDRFARDAAVEELMHAGVVRRAVENIKAGVADADEMDMVRRLVEDGRIEGVEGQDEPEVVREVG